MDPTPIVHRVIYGNFSFQKEYRNDNVGDKI